MQMSNTACPGWLSIAKFSSVLQGIETVSALLSSASLESGISLCTSHPRTVGHLPKMVHGSLTEAPRSADPPLLSPDDKESLQIFRSVVTLTSLPTKSKPIDSTTTSTIGEREVVAFIRADTSSHPTYYALLFQYAPFSWNVLELAVSSDYRAFRKNTSKSRHRSSSPFSPDFHGFRKRGYFRSFYRNKQAALTWKSSLHVNARWRSKLAERTKWTGSQGIFCGTKEEAL